MPTERNSGLRNTVCVFCAFVAYAVAAGVKADEAWYVPGWMRTKEPEELAWNSFTNVFSAGETSFRKWDGNQLWPTAAKNADLEAVKLADEIKKMPEGRRARLTLVGHSLGGRIVARALARLSLDGVKIKRGILLAPAIPAYDNELQRMGLGSKEPPIRTISTSPPTR